MKSWFKRVATDLLERSETKQSRVSSLIAYNSLGKPVWTPKRYDKLAEEGFAKNVIVYRAVNLIAAALIGKSILGQRYQKPNNGRVLEDKLFFTGMDDFLV